MNNPIIGSKLNESQLKAVKSPLNKPLLIVAGAGSGKTLTLTERLRELIRQGLDPRRIVAITFTNKAASEMKTRLEDLPKGAFIGTFHSFGVRLLRSEAKKLNRHQTFSIFDHSDSKRLVAKIIKDLNLDRKQYGAPLFLNRIGYLKNNLADLNDFLTSSQLIDRLSAEVFTRYEAELIANNAFDFDDLISKPVQLFRTFPSILEKYRLLFTHILVDEYQDVNAAQYQLVKLLAGPERRLTVVGDDNQAIYAFRGADFRNFLNFDSDFSDSVVVVLDQNYRSTGNIIKSANSVISNNKDQRPKNLWTANSDGSLVTLAEHDSETSEADWLVGQLLSRRELETAIIYRTNAQSRPIEQALIESGLPYHIFGGLKFYDRKEVKDLVAALRFAWNPNDSLSLERLDKSLYKKEYRELAASLPRLASELPPGLLLKEIIKVSDYLNLLKKKFPNAYERIENISELQRFVEGFSDLGSLMEKISLFESSDSRPQQALSSSINLMTIHLAKGLEFDRVFLVGASEGLLPHERSCKTIAEIEEERRLLYVAMTRAKQELNISFFDIPSRFLSEIPSELIEYHSPLSRDLDDEERYISI